MRTNKNHLFEVLILSTPGNIYMKSIDGKYITCNKNQLDLLGFNSVDDLVNKSDYDLYSFEIAKQLFITDQEIMKNKKEVTFEEKGIDRHGNPAIYLTTKTPVLNTKNKVTALIGVSKDITKEKEAEITRANFISNMQHDLRTPFAGISAIAGLLRDMEDNPEKQSLLDDLLTSCEQWEQTHHEIIAVLSDQKPYAIAKETFVISQELGKIGDSLAATLRTQETTLVIEDIPDAIDSIETDRLKFSLILSNIIGNAVKFTKKGTIKIKVSKKDSTYSIAVIDTGVGIPEDKLDSIFEQFTKLSNSNKHNQYQGVGLGLYMARQIATLLGGTIAVTSKINEGSTFTLSVPT